MKIRHLMSATIFSCITYALVFLFVVHKPLTVGVMSDYFSRKLNYLAQIERSKIVILAGSNGRFSHRCETIEKETGIPCSNMSIAAGISLDYQLTKIKQYLRAGDLVYLPLEYGQLNVSKEQMLAGAEIPFIVAYDKKYLMTLGPRRIVNALFFFDMKFFLSAVAEMTLNSLSFKRRFSVDTITSQGDEKTHTREKARLYTEYLTNLEWGTPGLAIPTLDQFNASSDSAIIVSDFMHWASNKKIKIVGGLPTVFDDQKIPVELLEGLCNFYRNSGHKFLILENRSQYPRHDFYDTPYHLSEEAQVAHTRNSIPELSEIFHGEKQPETCTF